MTKQVRILGINGVRTRTYRKSAYSTYRELHKRGLEYNRHLGAWAINGINPVFPGKRAFRQILKSQISQLPEELQEAAVEEAEEEAQKEKLEPVQEVHIYGIQNKRDKNKREYGIFELRLDVPAN